MTPSSLSKDRERGKARACNSKPPPPSLAFPAHWLPFGSKRVHNPLHCRPHDYRSRPTSPRPSSPPLAVSCLYRFQEKEGRLSSVSQLTAEETEAGLGLSKLTLPRAPGLRHPPSLWAHSCACSFWLKQTCSVLWSWLKRWRWGWGPASPIHRTKIPLGSPPNETRLKSGQKGDVRSQLERGENDG